MIGAGVILTALAKVGREQIIDMIAPIGHARTGFVEGRDQVACNTNGQ